MVDDVAVQVGVTVGKARYEHEKYMVHNRAFEKRLNKEIKSEIFPSP